MIGELTLDSLFRGDWKWILFMLNSIMDLGQNIRILY